MSQFKYSLIIDTDQYAGNFERELCAYITGHVGECDVGQEYARQAIDDGVYPSFDGLIDTVPDDYGCWRPVNIYASGNGDYNSVQIHLMDIPTSEIVNIVKERAYKFSELSKAGELKWVPEFNVTGFKLIEEGTTFKATKL